MGASAKRRIRAVWNGFSPKLRVLMPSWSVRLKPTRSRLPWKFTGPTEAPSTGSTGPRQSANPNIRPIHRTFGSSLNESRDRPPRRRVALPSPGFPRTNRVDVIFGTERPDPERKRWCRLWGWIRWNRPRRGVHDLHLSREARHKPAPCGGPPRSCGRARGPPKAAPAGREPLSLPEQDGILVRPRRRSADAGPPPARAFRQAVRSRALPYRDPHLQRDRRVRA